MMAMNDDDDQETVQQQAVVEIMMHHHHQPMIDNSFHSDAIISPPVHEVGYHHVPRHLLLVRLDDLLLCL